ncbi:MAG: hypothetical protein NUW01_04290 [Gemmatimonadaceae bacterium]|nr:hypothetical protein [Gemmatimonadaceae bacterium]
MNAALGILVAVLVFSSPVAAQMAGLGAGARVRVTSPRDDLKKHVTTVTDVRGDSIVVAGRAGSRTIAISNVTALEVSAGRRMRVVPYALLGFGVGAIGGFALGYASYDDGSYLSNSPSDEGTWAGATLGVLGMFTGAIVGVFHRGDHWVPAQPPVRAAMGLTRSGRVSVGLARAF